MIPNQEINKKYMSEQIRLNEIASDQEDEGGDLGLETFDFCSSEFIQPKFMTNKSHVLGPWEDDGEQTTDEFSGGLQRPKSHTLPNQSYLSYQRKTSANILIKNNNKDNKNYKQKYIGTPTNPSARAETYSQNCRTNQQLDDYDSISRMNSNSQFSSSPFSQMVSFGGRQKPTISLHHSSSQDHNKQMNSSLAAFLQSKQNHHNQKQLLLEKAESLLESKQQNTKTEPKTKTQQTETNEEELNLNSISYDEQYRYFNWHELRQDVKTAPARQVKMFDKPNNITLTRQLKESQLKITQIDNDERNNNQINQPSNPFEATERICIWKHNNNPSRVTIQKHLEINGNVSRPLSHKINTFGNNLSTQITYSLGEQHQEQQDIQNYSTQYNMTHDKLNPPLNIPSMNQSNKSTVYLHSSIYFTLKKPIIGSISLQKHGKQVKKKNQQKQLEQILFNSQPQQHSHSTNQFNLTGQSSNCKSLQNLQISQFPLSCQFRGYGKLKNNKVKQSNDDNKHGFVVQMELDAYQDQFHRQLNVASQNQQLNPESLRNRNTIPSQSLLKKMKSLLEENNDKNKTQMKQKPSFHIDKMFIK